jgi:mediator of RNA polymerase II transcription subunit 17
MNATTSIPGDGSVEKEISSARDSIFDEELHHEIHREARNLVNQGVRCIDNSVLIPFETDKQIEIDLVPTKDSASEYIHYSSPVVANIATSLRILLSYAHRQNLRNRSEKPPPLRESRVPRPPYAILKPVIEYFQHRSHVQSIHTFLEQLHNILAVAGLDLSIETAGSFQNHAIASLVNKKSYDSAVETLIKQLTSPPHSTMTMRLPDGATNITIDIHTALHPPTLGTSFLVTNENIPLESPIAQLSQSMQYSSLAALESHLLHLTTLSILHHLLSSFDHWRIFSPHSTSIMRTRPGSQDRDMASVMLERERLSLNWQRNGRFNDQGIWTWDTLGLEGGGEKRSLTHVFRSFC